MKNNSFKTIMHLNKEAIPWRYLILVSIISQNLILLLLGKIGYLLAVGIIVIISLFFVYVISETAYWIEQKAFKKWQEKNKDKIMQAQQKVDELLKIMGISLEGEENERQQSDNRTNEERNSRTKTDDQSTEETTKDTIPKD